MVGSIDSALLGRVKDDFAAGRWNSVARESLLKLEQDQDSVFAWQLFARAMDEGGDSIVGAVGRERLSRAFDRDVIELSSRDLALAAYSRAWLRSDKSDEIAAEGRKRLRAELGFSYEDWCWSCHEYLSDAPFDNAGRCYACNTAEFQCFICRTCGARRHDGSPRL